ncbi:MFS transporter [Paeniglutamicibacter sp. MACA_103]|uniref:MFS transporter n=1 Tax=Paeniglutamicibacter sp. MACA_103 TaxID=3377337 RepID=UPI0038938931
MATTAPQRALPGLLLAMVLVPLDQTSLTPALPDIAAELGGLHLMPLVIASYLAAVTAALPLGGKLGDRYGRKPVLLASLALFVAGALACAASGSFALFAAARVVQGLGGGGLMIGAQATLGDLISPRERGRYLGWFGVAYLVPAVAGPLVGGVLVQALSWRWIFLLPAPLGLAALVLVHSTVHLPRPVAGRRFDTAGTLALAGLVVAVVALAGALSGPAAPPWVVAASLLLLAAAGTWWAHSLRHAEDPVLPPGMLRRRGVLVPLLLSFTVGFALLGILSYMPALARLGLGLDPVSAGLVITATMLGAILTMSLSGRRISATGHYRRYPIFGTALMAVAALALGVRGAELDVPELAVLLFTLGLGVGLVMQVVMLAAQNAADVRDLGAATSGVLFSRQIGASIGAALIGTLITAGFASRLPPGIPGAATMGPAAMASLPPPLAEQAGAAFAGAVPAAILAVVPILFLAFLLALALPALHLRSSTPPPLTTTKDAPMNATAPDPLTPILPLSALGPGDLAVAGGKAVNLGELLRAGFEIPDGFVVTTAAYGVVAGLAGVPALLEDSAGDPEPEALRRALLETPIPAPLADSITAAYRRLGDRVPVAVRSSATAEDLPGAAFAGQQDTLLNVIGVPEVLDAVRRCWASLFTDRAVAYRRERGIDPAEVQIAVVIQAMVFPEVAGVMFTADPVSGARDRVVINAGAGLGESVVSGLVTPDRYTLDAEGRVLDRSPGRGEVQIRAVDGGGVQRIEAGHATGDALLTDLQLAGLAREARRIAEHFGRPQDIEWAVARGKAWIVQARAMTALPPDTPPLNRIHRLEAAILMEYLPQRPYPLDVTTQLEHGPAGLMRDMAVYYGLRGAFENYLRELDGVVVELVPPSPRPTPKALLTPLKLVRKARRHRPAQWMEDPRQLAYLAEVGSLEELDLAALDWTALCAVPVRALATQAYCRDLRIDYLPASGLAVARLAVASALLGRRRLVPSLLGGARTRTEDSNLALAALASRVSADPALASLLATQDAATAWQELKAGNGFGDFTAAMDRFLAEYGRRETASPLLVSPPTLAESPGLVLGMVQSLVQAPDARSVPPSSSSSALDELLRHPLLRTAGARKRVGHWVRAAREGVAFREDSHFYFTAALPTLRRSLLEIGRRLTDAGVLKEPFEVFHLRWEEIAAIGEPHTLDAAQREHLVALVARRAAARAALAGVPLINPARVFPASPGEALATGTPAGAGIATGLARIIREPADFDRLGNGEVLVCPYTNPAWTPLFQRAAAVVVDTGSPASHAAIVAREYGLPAITGTGNGTSLIADGQAVTVDGARGTVMPAKTGDERR